MDAPAETAVLETQARPSLIGLDRDEIAALVAGMDEPAFRARQLWHWVYHRGARSFDEMTSLAKSFRAKLAERHTLDRPRASRDLLSEDGTRKWLLAFDDGQEAESVLIPEDDRGTLCVSSQVGCTLNCTFCHTGTQRLVRNLDPREIVGQLMLARDAIGEWPTTVNERQITNIVMMGMGEPLYNYDNVAKALRIVMDPDGLAMSRKRITLSTAGVVPMIERCGRELDVNLAVSLHAVSDEIRDAIVPINRKYPIAELLAACRAYPSLGNARRITFEYVMLNDVNDSAADARALVKLVRDIPAKINLIPFNAWPGAPYECSTPARIEAFKTILHDAHLVAITRTPRGRDIMAACGQLKSASVKKRRSEVLAAERA
ncbi:MAG: 23S rRNA (adenine(2503)-C(2))-methyltransferase RlmN [Alphaproteobacteria bacterium]|nr:23S rRNA (adenine(2503)-C(2))-methyltransferase RlmN [Alphaproteobacteria bacterium]